MVVNCTFIMDYMPVINCTLAIQVVAAVNIAFAMYSVNKFVIECHTIEFLVANKVVIKAALADMATLVNMVSMLVIFIVANRLAIFIVVRNSATLVIDSYFEYLLAD